MGAKPVLAVAAAAAALLVAVAPARPASRAACLTVRSSVRNVLAQSLRPAAKGRLGMLRAVRASGRFRGAPGTFGKGAYFVSAVVRGRGAVATWAVDSRAFTTGGGSIFAVGKTARSISYLGATFSPSTLAAWGISPRTVAFKQSRACVTTLAN